MAPIHHALPWRPTLAADCDRWWVPADGRADVVFVATCFGVKRNGSETFRETLRHTGSASAVMNHNREVTSSPPPVTVLRNSEEIKINTDAAFTGSQNPTSEDNKVISTPGR